MPWHMTLVYLLTQTLGTVLNMRAKALLSMIQSINISLMAIKFINKMS